MSGEATFQCNLCGVECPAPAQPPGREVPSCPSCQSTVRLRGLGALLSRELFGAYLALPDFPNLKDVRAIGMSDPPLLAQKLEAKFGYTNTFYHQPPHFDVTRPDPADSGRYDFIVSSEVMEHVPPPVEGSFANLCRMLQPNGFLLLTVPYRPSGLTEEHFASLNQYALATAGGKTVLVNRRQDGEIEIFQDLCFHSGHGSTLEMRVFSEESLRKTLLDAGFAEVEIAHQDVPEFGVVHAETWSLPIVARKGKFASPAVAVSQAYRAASVHILQLEAHIRNLVARIEQVNTQAAETHTRLTGELEQRLEWVRKVEAEFEDRTAWALSLKKEVEESNAEVARLQQVEADGLQKLSEVERLLQEAKSAIAALESQGWTRLGRKLNIL